MSNPQQAAQGTSLHTAWLPSGRRRTEASGCGSHSRRSLKVESVITAKRGTKTVKAIHRERGSQSQSPLTWNSLLGYWVMKPHININKFCNYHIVFGVKSVKLLRINTFFFFFFGSLAARILVP